MAQGYKANGILSPEFDWGWSSPSFQMKASAADLAKVTLFQSDRLGTIGSINILPFFDTR